VVAPTVVAGRAGTTRTAAATGIGKRVRQGEPRACAVTGTNSASAASDLGEARRIWRTAARAGRQVHVSTASGHHMPVLTAEQASAAVDQRRADMVGRLEAAGRAQEQLAQLRVHARSTQTDIDAVVSGRGTLLELSLGEEAVRLRPQALAAEIVATVQRACARAGAETTQLLAPLVPADVDLAGVVLDPPLAGEQPHRAVQDHSDEPDEPESWLRPADGGRPR